MKVCGFTFIRNAGKFDFPVTEAIQSVLPVCDHFVVAVGNSEDNTRQILERIGSEKITLIDTVWDEALQQGGAVYAAETDKAFDAISPDYDWCFYIQGDEVLHEKFLPSVRQAMERNLERREVEGLLFGYKHFYGTYDCIGDSRKWYRNEIRIIRNNKSIRSYRDAQGFRINGRKLRVVDSNGEIYHYGWVRHPRSMQEKIDEVYTFYHGASGKRSIRQTGEPEFSYSSNYDALVKFEETHPRVMEERIKRFNWKMEADLSKIHMKLRYRLLYFFEKLLGVRLFEYRNYRLINRRKQ